MVDQPTRLKTRRFKFALLLFAGWLAALGTLAIFYSSRPAVAPRTATNSR